MTKVALGLVAVALAAVVADAILVLAAVALTTAADEVGAVRVPVAGPEQATRARTSINVMNRIIAFFINCLRYLMDAV